MIIKYISFLIGIIWSYSIIKTQSIFSKKAGLIFKVFISNISWFTLIAACYFGYKNFSIQYTMVGIIVGIIIVHIGIDANKIPALPDVVNSKPKVRQIGKPAK